MILNDSGKTIQRYLFIFLIFILSPAHLISSESYVCDDKRLLKGFGHGMAFSN